MFFAHNLKYLRKRDGFTQEGLSARLGIAQSSLANYEAGIREPELNRLVEISEFFKVTVDDLLKNEIKPQMPIYVSNIKYLRKKHNMSQQEMAKILGYSGKQGYNAIEIGATDISVVNLVKLADFFGVTLDELVKQDLSKRR